MAETTSVAALRREMELMRAEQSRMHRVIVQQQIEGLTKQQWGEILSRETTASTPAQIADCRERKEKKRGS